MPLEEFVDRFTLETFEPVVQISAGPGTMAAASSATGVQTVAVEAVLADKMGDAFCATPAATSP